MFWQGRERFAKSALVLFPSPVERAACAAHREEPLLHGDKHIDRWRVPHKVAAASFKIRS